MPTRTYRAQIRRYKGAGRRYDGQTFRAEGSRPLEGPLGTLAHLSRYSGTVSSTETLETTAGASEARRFTSCCGTSKTGWMPG
eukprot:6302350-Pyramimonas_sp.AAC.1